MADRVLTPTGLTCFLVAETAVATTVFPTAAQAVQLREGLGFPTQPTAHTPIPEVMDTGSVPGLIRDLRAAGTFRLPFFPRPSGSAGTAPMEDQVLTALLGTETVSAGSSVTYTPTADQGSYTLWFGLNDSNTVIHARGATMNGFRGRQGENGPPELEVTGQFAALGWCGESTLTASVATGVSSIVVADSTMFSPQSYLQVGTETASHKVTAVATGTHTLTLSTAIASEAQANGAAVSPFALPTPTQVGEPIDTRAVVKINNVAVNWSEWTIEYDRDVSYYAEVPADPSTADYPQGYTAKFRRVAGTVAAILRTSVVNRLRAVATDGSLKIDWTARAAGKRLLLTLAQGRWNVAESEYADPTLRITARFDAKASASLEDEIEIKYS